MIREGILAPSAGAGTRSASSLVLRRYLALGHGLYYLITGLWPLVDIRSFLAVTGPKVDLWLVKTVGVLLSIVGAVVAAAGVRRRIAPEVAALAAASAVGLAGIDLVYALRGRISRIYLAEAAVELGLVVAWAAAHGLRPHRGTSRPPGGRGEADT